MKFNPLKNLTLYIFGILFLQASPILQLTTEDAILIGQMISATQMLFMDKLSKGNIKITVSFLYSRPI